MRPASPPFSASPFARPPADKKRPSHGDSESEEEFPAPSLNLTNRGKRTTATLSVSRVADGSLEAYRLDRAGAVVLRLSPPSAGVQDYAETTMNELLGWYGYEKAVDSRDTQGLNLTHFAPSSSDSGREDSGNERRHHRHRGPTPHHRHAGQRTSSGTADEGAPATTAGGGDSSPRADGECTPDTSERTNETGRE
ncbi:hypothetical protein HPB47_022356 [Ixodes persulcatus]|uniref:Uncharacterized protein n=1 Tax=Ixodes persulcatus TaxID=34615 RepID=A0AC60QCB5_IXOPE|nr:hypothetical protein HPB47_022356 [Ixodes persulcatus]